MVLEKNHDNQANITHLAELKRELEVAPNTYTRPAPPGVGGSAEAGPGSYWVPVRSHLVYCVMLTHRPFRFMAKKAVGESPEVDMRPF